MKTLLLIIPIIAGITALAGITKHKPAPIVIQGKVVVQANKKPVSEAYLYITIGEEEAITDKDGSFTIKTWQSLPATITVEHKRYVKKKVNVTDNNKLLIELQEK